MKHAKCELCASTRCPHTSEDVEKFMREYRAELAEEEAFRREMEDYYNAWGN